MKPYVVFAASRWGSITRTANLCTFWCHRYALWQLNTPVRLISLNYTKSCRHASFEGKCACAVQCTTQQRCEEVSTNYWRVAETKKKLKKVYFFIMVCFFLAHLSIVFLWWCKKRRGISMSSEYYRCVCVSVCVTLHWQTAMGDINNQATDSRVLLCSSSPHLHTTG